MIESIPTDHDDVLGFRLTGKLQAKDYDILVPRLDAALDLHDKLNLFVVMEDFDGWDMGGLWEDTKFGVTHFTRFNRIAIVGDEKWEKWMAAICKPFTTATVKYFDADEHPAARQWAEAGSASVEGSV